MKTWTLLAAAAALAASAGSALAASPGETAFQQRCTVCHSIQPAPGKLGPPLAGVVGRKAGAVPGFAYSDALKKSNIVWTPAKVADFIKAPQQMVPGTKMMVAVPNAQMRTDIAAYLATQKK